MQLNTPGKKNIFSRSEIVFFNYISFPYKLLVHYRTTTTAKLRRTPYNFPNITISTLTKENPPTV